MSLQTLGPFSDRSGSDALRKRIAKLEQLQISNAPWYGNGPGTSKVEVQGSCSSSTTATWRSRTRLAGSARCCSSPRARSRWSPSCGCVPELRNPWYEAAIIAVAVCAVNLGEVLLELPTALALGMAAYYVQTVRGAAGRASSAIADPAPSTRYSCDDAHPRRGQPRRHRWR